MTARVRPVLRVVTTAKHLTEDLADTQRRAALVWLKSVANDPESRRADTASASEWIVSLDYGKRPSDGAVEWMRRQAGQRDLVKRAWARACLELVGVEP